MRLLGLVFPLLLVLLVLGLVVLFLVARRLRHWRRLSPEENLVNAIELAKEDAIGRISRSDRDRALIFLNAAVLRLWALP